MAAFSCATFLTLLGFSFMCRAFTPSSTFENVIFISNCYVSSRIDLSASERTNEYGFAETCKSNVNLEQSRNHIKKYSLSASSGIYRDNQVEADLLRRQAIMTTHILKKTVTGRIYSSPNNYQTKTDLGATSIGERRVGNASHKRNASRDNSLALSIVDEVLKRNIVESTVHDEIAERTSALMKSSGVIGRHVINSTIENTFLNRPTSLQSGRTILRESSPSSIKMKNTGQNELIVRIAFPEDDLDIAHLRLSVFSDFTPDQVKQYRVRACEVLNSRRLRGAYCLVVSTNPSPTKSVQNIAGSLEISTHEFDGTYLGSLRPKGSILYVTEVAVSSSLRQNGIGTMLMKGLDKIAMMQNIETVYLHVDVTNTAALRLYEKAGYEILDTENPIFKQFTTKLNLHDGATKGRTHHLLHKRISNLQTWFEPSPVEVTQKILGFRVTEGD
jgi:ribosomal protein S18 acetylase RimI-like enzyme